MHFLLREGQNKTYYSTVYKNWKSYISKAVLACPLIITSITHRYPAPQWRSAVWWTCARPYWCAPRSSQRDGRKCVWPGHLGRWPPGHTTRSSHRSRQWSPASCGTASAPSAPALYPAADRNDVNVCHPSAGAKRDCNCLMKDSQQFNANVLKQITHTKTQYWLYTYVDMAGFSISLRHNLHVPQVQDGGNYFKDAHLMDLFHTCITHSVTMINIYVWHSVWLIVKPWL